HPNCSSCDVGQVFFGRWRESRAPREGSAQARTIGAGVPKAECLRPKKTCPTAQERLKNQQPNTPQRRNVSRTNSATHHTAGAPQEPAAPRIKIRSDSKTSKATSEIKRDQI